MAKKIIIEKNVVYNVKAEMRTILKANLKKFALLGFKEYNDLDLKKLKLVAKENEIKKIKSDIVEEEKKIKIEAAKVKAEQKATDEFEAEQKAKK
jgi:hypothetical protein